MKSSTQRKYRPALLALLTLLVLPLLYYRTIDSQKLPLEYAKYRFQSTDTPSQRNVYHAPRPFIRLSSATKVQQPKPLVTLVLLFVLFLEVSAVQFYVMGQTLAILQQHRIAFRPWIGPFRANPLPPHMAISKFASPGTYRARKFQPKLPTIANKNRQSRPPSHRAGASAGSNSLQTRGQRRRPNFMPLAALHPPHAQGYSFGGDHHSPWRAPLATPLRVRTSLRSSVSSLAVSRRPRLVPAKIGKVSSIPKHL